MKVFIKEGSSFQLEKGANLFDLADAISPRLKKKAIIGKVNDILVDMSTILNEGDYVELFTLDSKEGLDTYRHSSAHIMAEAVRELFPDVKYLIQNKKLSSHKRR